MIKRIMTKRRNSLPKLLPICYSLVLAVLVLMLVLAEPALATKLSPALTRDVKTVFGAETKIRLDGSLETKSGEHYLPALPPGFNTRTAPGKVLSVHPARGLPDLVVFEGGFCYVRVIKRPSLRTLPPLSGFDEKGRKYLASCRLVADLIVPEEFVLASEYKHLVGDLAITVGQEPPASPLTTHTKDDHKKSLGGIYVTSPATGSIILVDEKSLKKSSEFPTEGTPLGMACVGNRLYIADQSKARLLIIDTFKREFVKRQIDLPPGAAPKAVAPLPNGQLLYVTESATGLVDCIETDTGKVLVRTKVPPGPSRMAVTANGNNVLVLNVPTGQLSIISTMNQKLIACINVGPSPQFITVAPDSKTAFVSCKSANHVVQVDLIRRLVVGQIKVGAGPTGLTLNHDGTKLFVACAKDNVIEEYDITSRAQLHSYKLPLDVDFPAAIALEPDGRKLLVTSAATDTIGLLDLEKEQFSQINIGRKSDDIVYVHARQ